MATKVRHTTKKDFDLFKRECRRWQKIFGLTGWRLGFEHRELEDNYAELSSNINGRTAVATLNLVYHEDLDVKISAKHEMLHLLLARMYHLGLVRFVEEAAWSEASEEAVRRLECLAIKDS